MIILFLIFSFSIAVSSTDDWTHFLNFQEKFNKKYQSIHELQLRFDIFRINLRNIISHNLDKKQNFTMGVNKFTDLTQEEFKKLYISGFTSLKI